MAEEALPAAIAPRASAAEALAASPAAGSAAFVPPARILPPPGAIILGGAHGGLAVARSLGRRGVPVWLLGADHPIAGLSRYVRKRVRLPPYDDVAALGRLLRLAEEGASGWVLFPASDAAVKLVAAHADRLARHFRLFTSPWPALAPLNLKTELYAQAGRLGIAVPKVYAPDEMPAAFPVLVKPQYNGRPNALTRAKAWRVDSAAELAGRRAEAERLVGSSGFLVQELVPAYRSMQFSYAGLWQQGVERAGLTVRRARQFPRDFGTSPFVETVDRPEIRAIAGELLAASRFHGLVEMDFIRDRRDGSFKPLDANTRVWAWIGLGTAAGIDFPWLAYRMALGLDVQVAEPAPARWVHPSHAVLSALEQLGRERRLDASAWRSLFGGAQSATFAPDDPLPGLLEFPLLVSRLARRLRAR